MAEKRFSTVGRAIERIRNTLFKSTDAMKAHDYKLPFVMDNNAGSALSVKNYIL